MSTSEVQRKETKVTTTFEEGEDYDYDDSDGNSIEIISRGGRDGLGGSIAIVTADEREKTELETINSLQEVGSINYRLKRKKWTTQVVLLKRQR